MRVRRHRSRLRHCFHMLLPAVAAPSCPPFRLLNIHSKPTITNCLMEHAIQQPIERSFYDRNRLLIKGLLIGFLILLMLIPAALIQDLVRERASRQEEVISEVSSKWGGSQTITGPVLLVPYNYTYTGADGKAI